MFRRGRRLRDTVIIRDLVRENELSVKDFILPIFVVEGENIKREISSLKGNYHWSVDRLGELVKELKETAVRSVIIFGVPEHKDCKGTEAYNEDGIVQKAIRKLRELDDELYIITDVCMCEYTDHGHCGILDRDGCVIRVFRKDSFITCKGRCTYDCTIRYDGWKNWSY